MTLTQTMPGTGICRRRVLVIYNPTAGQWRRRRLRATLRALEGEGCTLTLHETTRPGDAEATAADLRAADFDVVVAAGGDGTINEVANGLIKAIEAIPPLAIIPLGTANVLAQEIGLHGQPATIAKAIAYGGRITVHLGLANGRHFIMMAGVGFDAHVVANVDLALKRHTGKIAYVLETLTQALRYGFPACRVTIDGVTRNARSVVVCNGRHYGGPFVAAPEASLGAPTFEVCLLERGGWTHVLRYGAALVMGRLAALSDVRILSARSLRIEGEDGLPVQGDGDIIATLPVDITVADKTLDLIVPE
ncbi:diacylglycerol kinase family lipid kinase [Telmatospirillum sp.]|uniref:diacylglycerol/lipid kinase family protein n=1 Tax=Telmatospirillum sp. TaxID=2079197 RepID=UPI0028484F52|nr:diacylglycerol kinase family lipid kinase [Telmatospirillum sp.]MDR3438506.1 diacylglycerol kinase family lipid kinase [Telmatospirillum sp.]